MASRSRLIYNAFFNPNNCSNTLCKN